MEENVQELLKDKNENVVQFNFENNTSSPVAITLFDTASLTTIPTSGSLTSTYTASNDLLPSLSPSILAQNTFLGTIIASDTTSPVLRLINANTTQNNFDNSIGFNQIVVSIAIQPDGKILIGGGFTTYKGVTANRIIRLNSDGTKDLTFDNSIGFDAIVNSIVIQPDGKIICGGVFTAYKGVGANRIIRLNSDGTKDLTFDNSIGFNSSVSSISIQPDGKIVCGGVFTTYKGLPENYIIRLNSDGTKDLTFDNSIGFNFVVLSVAIQSDGKILVGGGFTTYKGVTNNYIIRLNSDGTKDVTFDNSIGFDDYTYSAVLQPDGKIICGGDFTTYKGLTENFIIRLNNDGTKDLTFDNSIGFDNTTTSIAIQSDGKILVGGAFTTYKGLTDNNYIIRLNSDGSKDLTFDNNNGFDASVISIALQPDGKILCGGQFIIYKGYSNNTIIELQSNGLSASTLNLSSIISTIIFSDTNNVFYASDGTNTYVIDYNGEQITNTIPYPANSSTYNSNNNSLYLLYVSNIQVIDCLTLSLVTTIPIPNASLVLSNLTTSNYIYFFDEFTSLLQKIDCSTNTLITINLSLPNLTTNVNSINFSSLNQLLYIASGSSNIIDIVNSNTDTYFNSITIPASNLFSPKFTAINPLTNQLFITDSNATNNKQFAVIDFTSNSLVSVNPLGGIGATYGVIYNSLTNSMYISGSLFSVVTFTASPFFIGGSVNYNTFVNSLNNEPIFIEEIRILTQNQTQLYNQVQFTKIDSSGNQIFFPEFPINKIDIEQNNNIANIQLYGLVFDGRTYINQYVINPNQIVSFEIYYKQLDRLSATPTFPIFFKPKIQLKEYIRKDYNNYDVEM
jgi:uncharacterized delta-60 repeat protein